VLGTWHEVRVYGVRAARRVVPMRARAQYPGGGGVRVDKGGAERHVSEGQRAFGAFGSIKDGLR